MGRVSLLGSVSEVEVGSPGCQGSPLALQGCENWAHVRPAWILDLAPLLKLTSPFTSLSFKF